MPIVTADRPLFLTNGAHCVTLLPGVPAPLHTSLLAQAVENGCVIENAPTPAAPAAPETKRTTREIIADAVKQLLDAEDSDPDDFRIDGAPKRSTVQRLVGKDVQVDAATVYEVYAQLIVERGGHTEE